MVAIGTESSCQPLYHQHTAVQILKLPVSTAPMGTHNMGFDPIPNTDCCRQLVHHIQPKGPYVVKAGDTYTFMQVVVMHITYIINLYYIILS